MNHNKELKTTEQWCKKLNINIIDHDGWDRKNLENSLNEYITLDEFNLRISKSTIAILAEKFINPDNKM